MDVADPPENFRYFAGYRLRLDDRFRGIHPLDLKMSLLAFLHYVVVLVGAFYIIGVFDRFIWENLDQLALTIHIGQNLGLIEICKYFHYHYPPRLAHRLSMYALSYNMSAQMFSVYPFWDSNYHFPLYVVSVEHSILTNFVLFVVSVLGYAITFQFLVQQLSLNLILIVGAFFMCIYSPCFAICFHLCESYHIFR